MISVKTKKFHVRLIFLAALLCQGAAHGKVETVLGSLPIETNPNLAIGLPESNLPEIVLSREQYVISYNKENRNPNWVAWKLELNQMGNSGRTNVFEQDSELASYLNHSGSAQSAVEPTEYKGSCLDRGHQIPSADRTDTEDNNRATFIMSNMIPQTPYLNRVIWEHLEHYTRELVRSQGKKVYVIAGPIYDEDFGMIGPKSNIRVPSKDFKVIFILDANQSPADISASTQSIAVIMPNTMQDGSHPTLDGSKCPIFEEPRVVDMNDWQKYQTTVTEVENLSGIKIIRH